MKLAMISPRLGPIQHARLRACAKLGDVTAIEMSGEDNTYEWAKVDGADGFRRITLFPDMDCDDAPPAEVVSRLINALDEVNPDVVVATSWGWNYSIAALDWSLSRHVANVVMTSTSAIDKPRKKLKEWIKRQAVKHFQSGLVAGRWQKQYVEQLGVPAERIWTGYDALDNQHFADGAAAARTKADELRAELKLPKRYFLTTCRFVLKKNLPTLYRAFSAFRKEHQGSEDWHLVVLGNGPLKGELLSLRDQLGLGDVLHMPGFKQYDELPTYYGLAGAFLLPSIEEQWGLVVNEAMSCGLPVVVSNRCGCSPELVIEGVTGYALDALDTRAWTNAFKSLAADSDLRERMGSAARAEIDKWSCNNFATNLFKAAQTSLALPRPKHSIMSRLVLTALMRMRNKPDLGQDIPAELVARQFAPVPS